MDIHSDDKLHRLIVDYLERCVEVFKRIALDGADTDVLSDIDGQGKSLSERGIRVMQIILNLKRAGAQEVVRTLTEYLASDNCEPIVCTFEDGPVRGDLESFGIFVEVLGPRRYGILALPWFIADVIHIRRKLVDLVRKHQVDVIQTHLLNMLDFLVLTLRRDTGLPIVLWTTHNVKLLPMGNNWLQKAKRLFYRVLYRLTARKVNGLIAISDEVRESAIRQIGPIQDKITTISNGVDIRRYDVSAFDKEMFSRQLGITPGVRLIVTVGRLTEQKGHRYLITAAAAVVSCFPDAHFLFVGDGELKGVLQAQAEDLDVSDHVHFLGVRSNVPDILAAADLFVLASLWEGLSIALLEAMASAKPIVATAVSGTTQVMPMEKLGRSFRRAMHGRWLMPFRSFFPTRCKARPLLRRHGSMSRFTSAPRGGPEILLVGAGLSKYSNPSTTLLIEHVG